MRILGGSMQSYTPSFWSGAGTVFGRKVISEFVVKKFKPRDPRRDAEEARAIRRAFERDMRAAMDKAAP